MKVNCTNEKTSLERSDFGEAILLVSRHTLVQTTHVINVLASTDLVVVTQSEEGIVHLTEAPSGDATFGGLRDSSENFHSDNK